MLNNMLINTQIGGSGGNVSPGHPKTMGPIAADVAKTPDVQRWCDALYETLCERNADNLQGSSETLRSPTSVSGELRWW